MEPQKRAKYSKSLDPDEIEEVLMDEECDEELEDRDKVVEPRVESCVESWGNCIILASWFVMTNDSDDEITKNGLCRERGVCGVEGNEYWVLVGKP